MDDPLLVPISMIMLFLYSLGMAGTSFIFEHIDMAYGYNPNDMLKATRSVLWFFSVMLVGLVVFLSGVGRSKGDYYGG